MTLTVEEYDLIRQAARNQNDDERNAASKVECGNCRAKQSEDAKRRARVREGALKKIKPQEAE